MKSSNPSSLAKEPRRGPRKGPRKEPWKDSQRRQRRTLTMRMKGKTIYSSSNSRLWKKSLMSLGTLMLMLSLSMTLSWEVFRRSTRTSWDRRRSQKSLRISRWAMLRVDQELSRRGRRRKSLMRNMYTGHLIWWARCLSWSRRSWTDTWILSKTELFHPIIITHWKSIN